MNKNRVDTSTRSLPRRKRLAAVPFVLLLALATAVAVLWPRSGDDLLRRAHQVSRASIWKYEDDAIVHGVYHWVSPREIVYADPNRRPPVLLHLEVTTGRERQGRIPDSKFVHVSPDGGRILYREAQPPPGTHIERVFVRPLSVVANAPVPVRLPPLKLGGRRLAA